jgi:CDGSH-type Zn-finger protein
MKSSPVRIVAYKDGPYLVRGSVEVIAESGHPIELRRRVVALCRCGGSLNRPFCDGTHRAIDFQAPAGTATEAR